jgi:enediyne biosynthesis protein E4
VKEGIAARIVLAIVFAGLVFSPLFIKRFAARHDETKTKLDLQTALSRHGFYLREVSHAAGVDFVHQAPTLDPRLNHIMPQVASMGASVSIVDFFND